MTAEEALRRARATANQLSASEGNLGAIPDGEDDADIWRLVVDGHIDLPDGVGSYDSWHQRAASALLDGFSVDEVTKAGG